MTEIYQLWFRKNTFWQSTLRLCRNFAPGRNQFFSWRSLSLWSKFSFEKIKSYHYDILEGYRATLSGAKSKMKTTWNAHNGPIFQFHMKVMTYLRRLGKEKIISIRRQSEKNNLKVFENLKKNWIPVINMDHNQIIDFEIFKKISQKIAFKSFKRHLIFQIRYLLLFGSIRFCKYFH